MKNTYLFYDIETSGLSKCFDQIIQFAAIRTDFNFNTLETHNFKISLRDDIVISPEALLVHKMGPKQLSDGIKELEGIEEIHRLMNEPGTISLGYNTLGFDDEFLRFSFYRNLLTPYTHQFKNKCSRMDIYPMAVFFYLFSKDSVVWPYIEDKVSLKLENLIPLNNLTKGSAHDAFADVEATLNLARLFSRETKVFEYLRDFFIKNKDKKRSESVDEAFQSIFGIHRAGLFVHGKIGSDNGFMAPFLCLGNSVPYSNQTVWLRLDSEEIPDLNKENIEEKTFVVRKKFGEPPFILPFYERFSSKLSKDKLKIFKENLKFFEKNQDIFKSLCNYHLNYRYPEIDGVDEDALLYERGFLNDYEVEKCRNFIRADFNDKIEILKGLDEINKKLGKRILFRNYDVTGFNELEDEKRKYFAKINPESSNEAPLDYMGNKRIVPKEALLKINEFLNSDINDSDKNLLLDLKEHINKNFFS
jgi:exodeoxyribonuclease-1